MSKRQLSLDPLHFQTFGDLLRYLRERARLSQRDLAQRVGYHYSYLSRLEKNVRAPDELILRTRFIPALRIENDHVWVERMFELAAAEQQTSASTPDPARVARWEPNIPPSLTPLLGREDESAALFQMLTSEETRVVTLIGPPGVGKTRLSLHIAEQLSSQFEDGAIFVDLMPILDHAQVIPALAAALGAQETLGSTVLENVKSVLRGRSLLIVMDNFEQVLDAAPQLLPLLAAAPGVKILATSREALRLRGEQEFPLPPLAVPNAKNRSPMDFPAVQLFVQRARAANPDLDLNDDDLARVAELCRRLDGLPLAIELAAARIRIFSPADMLEQFDRRFQWLANTAREVPEWRRTLWAAIAWSYNLLGENERALFARLSIFAGGWTVESAEAVCCDAGCPRSEALEIILRLVEKSLVVAEAGGRYRYLDTIGKFAHEKLEESGALETTGRRHLRHFADWSEALEAQFHALAPLTFQARTGVEQNNIRAALDWALAHPDSFLDGLRLSIPANLIWLEHGQVRDEYERALAFLRGADDPSLRVMRARLLLRTAALGARIGQGDLAYAYCREAESIARELNDRSLLAASLLMLGDMDRDNGIFDRAETSLNESVAIYRELNLPAELNHSLTAIGNNFFHQGRRAESDRALDEALTLADRVHDYAGLGSALRVRATNLRFEECFAEALDAFQRALQVARASGDRPNAGICLVNLSLLSNILGDYPASEKFAVEAINVFHSLGDEDQQAYPKRMLAYALLHQGLPKRAQHLALESLQANVETNLLGLGTLSCLLAVAEIQLAQKQSQWSATLFGFVQAQVGERYASTSPDALSFGRVRDALTGKRAAAWMEAGAAMSLEEAVALAMQKQENAVPNRKRKKK